MTQIFLACRDCGLIHSVAGRLPAERWLVCRRCGRRLWRSPPGTLDRPLAYTVAVIILFGLATGFALFEISFLGDHRSGMIMSGAIQLTRYSTAIAGVAVLVALIAMIIPAVTIALRFSVLTGITSAGRANPRSRPVLAAAWKLARHLHPWSMLDVYLLGAAVAYSRLRRLTDVAIGVGGYALAALVFIQVLLEQSLGRQRIWRAIGDPAQYAPKPGEPWILCLDCELVAAIPSAGSDGRRRCPRCGSRLVPRRPASLATTAAFTLAGYILYLPANVQPVLTITRFGRTEPYTILGGVRDLAEAGLWPLAVLVLFASILVPVLKLAGLSWFLVAIRFRSTRLLRLRTALYRLIDFIGRWSNIDVFMISIVSALLQFGILTTVDPGPGIASFAAVVVLTMIATRAFDPRLMWDATKVRR